MKADLYTKIMLTVIAVCLACIVLKNISIVTEAQAQSTYNYDKVMRVNIVQIDDRTFDAGDVTMYHPYLPVKIVK